MKASQKGKGLERKAADILEADGYLVHRTRHSGMMRGGKWFSQSNDIFHAFDLIAAKAGERPRFIQVTTAGHKSDRVKKVAGIPLDDTYASVEIWAWVGGRKRRDKRYKKDVVYVDAQYFWACDRVGNQLWKERANGAGNDGVCICI